MDANPFALNMFQNCNITKTVKKADNSYGVIASPNQKSIPSSTTINSAAVPRIERDIAGVMIKSLLFRGFSFITLRLGGSDASASAANVSIIRLTHSICVTVSGNSLPKTEPNSTITTATTLIVS